MQIHSVLLLLLLLLIQMGYDCIGCKRKFDKKGSLRFHEGKCPEYKAETQNRRLNFSKITERRDAGPSGSGQVNQVTEEFQENHPQIDAEPEPMEIEPEPIQEYRRSGLPRRKTRLPKRYQDLLPAPPPIVNTPAIEHELEPIPEEPIIVDQLPDTSYATAPNSYGVYRVYKHGVPSFNPDNDFSIDRVADNPNFESTSIRPSIDGAVSPLPFSASSEVIIPAEHALANKTTLRLLSWFYNGSEAKSLRDMDLLVHNVLRAPDFQIDDLATFDAAKAVKALDQFQIQTTSTSSPTALKDGWCRTSIPIRLPCDGVCQTEDTAPEYELEGLLYRNLIEVLKATYQEHHASQFHLSPFEEYWKPSSDSPPERIYSELYNCDAYLQENERVQAQARKSGSEHEAVIAPLMVWSDATHLAQFGNASLWPVYLYNGNQSKYTRAKPSAFAAHHLAYIPKLDDALQDIYQQFYGKAATADTLTYLRREVMHAVWRLLLDDNFMEAYENGIVIRFPDGIERRLFPRFFTYSADYQEKVILVTIKHLGHAPCPRCLVTKDQIQELGMKRDQLRRERLARKDDNIRKSKVETARKLIFEKGIRPSSKKISNILGEKSLTPNRNAFSERLGPKGVNFHSLFVVDLLHEFELGVWKATFTHLMRILHAQGGDSITRLNERYRQVPTFSGTIRRFNSNASGMKKLAARDFEDLLQCAIPVFDGLLSGEHNGILLDLLFELATWHGFAKLRLHTESTLMALEGSTTRLGTTFRKFMNTTCAAFDTRELPSEEASRGRRKAAMALKKGTMSSGAKGKQRQDVVTQQRRKFFLNTYKAHALGDYPTMIRLYGACDGYSTQTGELEHRRCKRFYPRVHKGLQHYAKGIANHVTRERVLNTLSKQSNIQMDRPTKRRKPNPTTNMPNSETIAPARPSDHYQVSNDTRNTLKLNKFLRDYEDDPSIKNFLASLKDHLLRRILKCDVNSSDSPFSLEERSKLSFRNNTLYRHKVLRINFTTYDMRREQDSLNSSRQANVMVLAPDDEDHPYWYARVIGVFHGIISHPDLPEPTHMDFLWVRWYGLDPDSRYRFGWKARRLPRIGFVEDVNDPNGSPPFGFVDPASVVRGVHLIPSFKDHRTADLLDSSTLARLPEEGDYDWNFFYVMIFLDRDMLMRYRGGGVGHTSTREATNRFLADRHPTDTTRLDDEPDSELLANECEEVPLQAMDDVADEDEDEDELEEDNNVEEEDYGYGGAGDLDEEDGLTVEEGIQQDAEEALDPELPAEADDDGIEDEVEQLGYARY